MLNVVRGKGTPDSIGLGAAAGTFIAVLPTPFLNILIGIGLAMIFKRLNRIALFSAIALFNPVVATPLYVLSYKIGDWIFGSEPVVRFKLDMLNYVFTYSRRFLVGSAIVATLMAMVTGGAAYYVADSISSRRRRRLMKRPQPSGNGDITPPSPPNSIP